MWRSWPVVLWKGRSGSNGTAGWYEGLVLCECRKRAFAELARDRGLRAVAAGEGREREARRQRERRWMPARVLEHVRRDVQGARERDGPDVHAAGARAR
jgi:hypothetical protein